MKILCRYQYDPLDRLTGLKPAEHLDTQRFYQNDELVNEIEGQLELTILRYEAQPLAQRLHVANVTETTLLATDQQRSVLHALAGVDAQPMTYTAYGHRPTESGLSSLLGFNGECPDSVTGHYLLGQGNRAFNPMLMRFNSPDELSPFGDGGINAYAYCGGDPVNRYDPSGNNALFRLWDNLISPAERLKALNLSKTISRTARPKSPWRPWKGPQANKNPTLREFLQKPSGVSSSAASTVAGASESIGTIENPVFILPAERHHIAEKFNPLRPPTKSAGWYQKYSSISRKYDELAAANKINISPAPHYETAYRLADTPLRQHRALRYAKENVLENMKLAEDRNRIRN